MSVQGELIEQTRTDLPGDTHHIGEFYQILQQQVTWRPSVADRTDTYSIQFTSLLGRATDQLGQDSRELFPVNVLGSTLEQTLNHRGQLLLFLRRAGLLRRWLGHRSDRSELKTRFRGVNRLVIHH
jgi:hypothetical protein